jgi:L-fuconolactonase
MRIDAHQHFWLPARVPVEWMDGLTGEPARRLVRPVLPSELQPILERQGVSHTVLVQVACNDAEAPLLFSLADGYPFIAGVVTWIDMQAPDLERQLDLLAAHPKFLGVRPMIENEPDPDWLRRPAVRRSFGVLEERGVCFDFLLKHHQLGAALEVLDAFPRLRAVIDHLAKPAIAERVLGPWREQMARASEHPNVYCKLSGLITEADHERWRDEDLVPYIAHAVQRFGARRCMFGSDWPVCTLAGSYDHVVRALDVCLSPLRLSPGELDSVYGGTAREFYRLSAPGRAA